MNEYPHCGQESESNPFSKMGEPVYGRGVDEEVCMNPRVLILEKGESMEPEIEAALKRVV